MAIQISFTAPSGVIAPEAYVYVGLLTEENGQKITAQIDIYYSKENKVNENLPIYSDIKSFTPNTSDSANNYRKQTYEYLKTLPQFEGAIDILESNQSIE
jgi:hypothetical protein